MTTDQETIQDASLKRRAGIDPSEGTKTRYNTPGEPYDPADLAMARCGTGAPSSGMSRSDDKGAAQYQQHGSNAAISNSKNYPYNGPEHQHRKIHRGGQSAHTKGKRRNGEEEHDAFNNPSKSECESQAPSLFNKVTGYMGFGGATDQAAAGRSSSRSGKETQSLSEFFSREAEQRLSDDTGHTTMKSAFDEHHDHPNGAEDTSLVSRSINKYEQANADRMSAVHFEEHAKERDDSPLRSFDVNFIGFRRVADGLYVGRRIDGIPDEVFVVCHAEIFELLIRSCHQGAFGQCYDQYLDTRRLPFACSELLETDPYYGKVRWSMFWKFPSDMFDVDFSGQRIERFPFPIPVGDYPMLPDDFCVSRKSLERFSHISATKYRLDKNQVSVHYLEWRSGSRMYGFTSMQFFHTFFEYERNSINTVNEFIKDLKKSTGEMAVSIHGQHHLIVFPALDRSEFLKLIKNKEFHNSFNKFRNDRSRRDNWLKNWTKLQRELGEDI